MMNKTPEMPQSQNEQECHWSFYELAIKERDFERVKCDRLEKENKELREELNLHRT